MEKNPSVEHKEKHWAGEAKVKKAAVAEGER